MVKLALAGLGRGGFVEAASGLEAIEQLTLTPAALMVLDLNMADMHGMDESWSRNFRDPGSV